RAVVMDGVTVGRPCCGVKDCQLPLQSQRHRFCELHKNKQLVCSVIGCRQPSEHPQFKTCLQPAHRVLEILSKQDAYFVLT
ncbi:uncharacterized protein BXZ73DRAFT_57303, partial [Epithele typhae]|uniref:uncharacterized protein n=1 Tax=Epithele typhae TaxID=378194 RepID=UPI002007675A